MRTKTALIADDEAPVRELLGRLLTQIGWMTIEVADGAAAVQELSRHAFDLVILDHHMPHLSGIDVLQIMRDSEAFRSLPVVFLSGISDPETIHQVITLGISDFLVKPLRPTVVKERLKRLEPTRTQALQPPKRPIGLPRRGNLLVVDTDAEYRRFMRTALMFRYEVAEAGSAIDALQLAASLQPGLCILGTDVGLMKPAFLANKLRESRGMAGVGLISVVRYGPQGAAPPFDGALRKTFVTAEFLAQFDALFPPAFDDEEHVLGRARRTVEGATEQAIGIMAATELTVATVRADALTPDHAQASVDVAIPAEHAAFRLVLRCPPECARTIGSLMLEIPVNDVTADDGLSTLGELANMVAGRVKTSLLDAAIEVTCTLPETSAEASAGVPQATDVVLSFTAGADQFVLYVLLQLLPSPAEAVPEVRLQESA